jgi:uncharacterized protein (DUF2062 family)
LFIYMMTYDIGKMILEVLVGIEGINIQWKFLLFSFEQICTCYLVFNVAAAIYIFFSKNLFCSSSEGTFCSSFLIFLLRLKNI